MLIFYILAFIAFIPIFAYLSSQKTNNKGIVFGFSFLIITTCLVIFISKFNILGTVNEQILNQEINDQIYIDQPIESKTFLKFNKTVDENLKKEWLIEYIVNAINLEKIDSAESLLTFSEQFFNSNEEKLTFYSLYKRLRDTKFPNLITASVALSSSSVLPCKISSLNLVALLNNGPEIPLAEKNFSHSEEQILTNDDSLIPGFDIGSAFLNNEKILLKSKLKCIENNEIYTNSTLLDSNNDVLKHEQKIELNQWLKN